MALWQFKVGSASEGDSWCISLVWNYFLLRWEGGGVPKFRMSHKKTRSNFKIDIFELFWSKNWKVCFNNLLKLRLVDHVENNSRFMFKCHDSIILLKILIYWFRWNCCFSNYVKINNILGIFYRYFQLEYNKQHNLSVGFPRPVLRIIRFTISLKYIFNHNNSFYLNFTIFLNISIFLVFHFFSCWSILQSYFG